MSEGLPIWTIYDHPSDWPGCYVARLWKGETPTDIVIVHSDLDKVREMLEERGLVKLDRMEGDDPVILETWL